MKRTESCKIKFTRWVTCGSKVGMLLMYLPKFSVPSAWGELFLIYGELRHE